MQKQIMVDLSDSMVEIPKGQAELIKKALNFYLDTAKRFVRNPSDVDYWEQYDMMQLVHMMDYPVNIEISIMDRESFCKKHGVDFPKYV